MAEGTGTSVGIITLDLRVVNKIAEQMNAIAASANKSAQQSFERVGKTVQESISKPVEAAGRTMEKAITAPVENAQKAVQETLKKTQQQTDDTVKQIDAIIARHQQEAKAALEERVKLPESAPRVPSATATEILDRRTPNAEASVHGANAPPAVVPDINGKSVQTAQTAGNAFARMADRIRAAFSSVNQSVQQTYSKVSAGAQRAAAQSVQAAQQSVKAVEVAEKRKSSASMGTMRTQVNAMLSAVTSTSQGIAKVGVMGRALSGSLTGSLSVAVPLAIAAAAFATLRKAISLATVNSDQFKKSLNEVKGNLEVAFTPIYQAILPALNSLMAWLAAATKQVAAFISALFGKTYEQSVAATKKMQQNAAAADKAKSGGGTKSQGQLAGFDELNVIGQKNGADGTDGVNYDALNTKGTEAANSLADKFKKVWAGVAAGFNDYVAQPIMDNLSKFDAPVASFKALFSNIGEQCRQWMTPLSNWFQTDFKSALSQGISDSSTILAGFMGSLAMVATTVWKTLQPAIDWIVKDGLPLLTDIFKEVSKTVVVAFDAVKTVFDTLWHGVIDPFAQFVSKVIVDIMNTFKSLWDQYGATTFENIRTTINTIKDTFLNVWNSFLKPIFDQLFLTLNQLWTDHLQPLVAQIGEFVMKLVNGAMEIYNGFIAPIVNWFVKTWGPPIAGAINEIIKIIGTIIGVVADVAKGLFKSLGGVVDFVVGIFTGNWQKAWQGVSDIFGGIFDGLLAIAKVPLNGIIGLINSVISGINTMISGLNNLNFKVPDWVKGPLAGKSIGFSIPPIHDIPYLANGGILTQPTLAMMGEYPGAKNNPEIAAPKSVLMDTFMEGLVPMLNLLSEMNENILNLDRDLNAKNMDVNLDGTNFSRALKPYFDEENKRVGGTLFSV